MNVTKDFIEKYKYFEFYNPQLIEKIETQFDVDYFPQGNDLFISTFVEAFKEVVRNQIRKF